MNASYCDCVCALPEISVMKNEIIEFNILLDILQFGIINAYTLKFTETGKMRNIAFGISYSYI